MIHKVFNLYDAKSEVFDIPMFAKTTNEMLRDLTAVVNRENDRNKLWLYPSDFTLFEVGEYDDLTGTFNTLDTPHAICLLHDLKVTDESADN